MQYSFATINFLPRLEGEPTFSLEEVIECAALAGFTGIGLELEMLQRFLARGHRLAEVGSLLDRSGVTCTDLVGLAIDGDPDRTLALARRMLDIAAVSGARICAANVAMPLGDELVALASRCADLLHPAGVRLTFEFTPVRPIDRIATTRALCKRIGWERAGVTLDPWHFFRGPDTWETLEELHPNEITLVQFDDALPAMSDDFFAETRLRRVMPGDGEFDLVRFVAAVRALGFDGIVSAEVLSADLRRLGPAEFTRRALASTTKYWG